MSIFSRIFGKRTTAPDQPKETLGFNLSSSGIVVTEDSALKIIAVFTCVRIIAENIASLPLSLFQRTADGRIRADWRAEHMLFSQQPNPHMDSFVFWETVVSHMVLHGNAYCEKEYLGTVPVAFWPIDPSRVKPFLKENGELAYKIDGGKMELSTDKIIHFRGYGAGGLEGKSVLKIGAEAMGLAIATEQFGARFFESDATPGVMLKHPGELSDAAQRRLKEGWDSMHRGVGRSHKTVVLEQGMTVEKLTIPPEDAQFLQTRKFQIAEIARLFRVPLHKLNELDKATFSNIEHQSLEFVMDTLRPWLVRIERALQVQVLPFQDRGKYYFEFNIDGLLRADIKSRYEAYAIGRNWGWLSANDVLRKENMGSIPGGDMYLRPANMIPADKKEEGK